MHNRKDVIAWHWKWHVSRKRSPNPCNNCDWSIVLSDDGAHGDGSGEFENCVCGIDVVGPPGVIAHPGLRLGITPLSLLSGGDVLIWMGLGDVMCMRSMVCVALRP